MKNPKIIIAIALALGLISAGMVYRYAAKLDEKAPEPAKTTVVVALPGDSFPDKGGKGCPEVDGGAGGARPPRLYKESGGCCRTHHPGEILPRRAGPGRPAL